LSTMVVTNAITTEQLVQRLQDQAIVDTEKNRVQKYVKRNLFEKVVFIFDKSMLDVGGRLYNDYMVNCRPLLADGKLMNVSDDVSNIYMNMLWNMMTSDECYVAWMGQKRSNTYQNMHDSFVSKYYTSRGW